MSPNMSAISKKCNWTTFCISRWMRYKIVFNLIVLFAKASFNYFNYLWNTPCPYHGKGLNEISLNISLLLNLVKYLLSMSLQLEEDIIFFLALELTIRHFSRTISLEPSYQFSRKVNYESLWNIFPTGWLTATLWNRVSLIKLRCVSYTFSLKNGCCCCLFIVHL